MFLTNRGHIARATITEYDDGQGDEDTDKLYDSLHPLQQGTASAAHITHVTFHNPFHIGLKPAAMGRGRITAIATSPSRWPPYDRTVSAAAPFASSSEGSKNLLRRLRWHQRHGRGHHARADSDEAR